MTSDARSEKEARVNMSWPETLRWNNDLIHVTGEVLSGLIGMALLKPFSKLPCLNTANILVSLRLISFNHWQLQTRHDITLVS